MQRIALTIALLIVSTPQGICADPIDTILNRAERYLRDVSQATDVRPFMRSLLASGQWPDIDYQDEDPAGWDVTAHLQRVRNMALAWTDRASPLYRNPELKRANDQALAHWLEARYQNRNWWHNQIGVPRAMKDILLLLRNDLRPDQFKSAMEILAQHRVRGIGANLIWTADLGLHYGALSGDEAMIRKCSDLISHEIKVSTDEGIQPDYSYHQHSKRLQMYHYGGAFLHENIKLAWELHGTPWAFPPEKTDILINFILEGWQWMARGIHTVPGTLDRSVSRNGTLRGADLRSLFPYVMELKPDLKPVLASIARRQDGSGEHLRGFKHYPYSDFSVYHHPSFSFFVKTISTRTLFSESINNENLKGALLNSGDTYFIRDGNEYFDLMPVWNWQYLPGITTFPNARTQRQEFTGGVSSGSGGLTVMHHVASDGDDTLSVKKVWAAKGEVVICLMADLRTQTDSVYTVLDQCRWRGDVLVNGSTTPLAGGKHSLRKARAISHSGFVYMPLENAAVEVDLTTNTGSWSEINASGSDEILSEKVFMPVIRHTDARSVAYAVVSAPPAHAKSLMKKQPWRILRNDGVCQAVSFDDGTVMFAFSSPGTVEISRRRTVSVDRPCALIVTNEKLYASDPSHRGGMLNVRVGHQHIPIGLPADGTTTSADVRPGDK